MRLISVRVDDELVKRVDEIAAKFTYATRSSVINNCIKAVLLCASEDDAQKVAGCYDPFGEMLVVQASFPRRS